jgi:AcrR family transcriptional regulator
MFIANGYAATTLADVASEAGIGARTLYLRFATKSELLLRCIGVAIVGDADDVPLGERDWMTSAMTAPSLGERIRQMASVTAQLMERTGDLLEVARQAAAVEPEIAAAAQAGREDTRRALVTFWHRAAKDGLLPREVDLEWLSETGALLAHADTYNLLRSTTPWDIAAYERWLVKTWEGLAGAAAAQRPRGAPRRPRAR